MGLSEGCVSFVATGKGWGSNTVLKTPLLSSWGCRLASLRYLVPIELENTGVRQVAAGLIEDIL